jgi:hypothetical protein
MFESGKIMSLPSCQKHVGLSNIINLGLQMNVLAEKSACDGAAVMVDEFSMKMKGCYDGWVTGGESCEL